MPRNDLRSPQTAVALALGAFLIGAAIACAVIAAVVLWP